MKKLFLFACMNACLALNAQLPADSVVMTVAGKQVALSEFLFMAQKNSEVDLSDSKSTASYIDLYKNFKLKVADAEALGLDQSKTFVNECTTYQNQLIEGFLVDKAAEEKVAKDMYDLGNEVLDISHILFRLPQKSLTKDTLLVYNDAMRVYEQLKNGVNFDALTESVAESGNGAIVFERIRSLQPMSTLKAFEEVVYKLQVGEVSKPVRTNLGFHVVKLNGKTPNKGSVRVAQIRFDYPLNATAKQRTATFNEAKKVYKLIEKGDDFATLAKTYSTDTVFASQGGLLPFVTQGVLEQALDKVAFELAQPGDVSNILETEKGYVILRLVEKKERQPFDIQKTTMMRKMEKGEYNFVLHQSVDDRLKKESGYAFCQEAYAELQALCNSYFPDDNAFFEQAKEMKKPLFQVYDDVLTQQDFLAYMRIHPSSTKTYAGDYMQEIYDLYVREELMDAEREKMDVKHPEVKFLMQEYRDGSLLFEVSNIRIWNKPNEEQASLEEQWVKELNEKYPVEINWGLLKQFYRK